MVKRDMENFSIRIPRNLRERIDVWADRAGLKTSEFLRLALSVGAISEAKRLGVFRETDFDENVTHSNQESNL